MELKDIKVGAPYLFNSTVYGRTAVHVTALYEGLVHFSIDGGEASRQVRDFPELSDGTHFALPARIERRVVTGKTNARALRADVKPTVQNTIREVPGVGKVAVVTFTPPVPLVKPAEALELPKERKDKRLSLVQALLQARKLADRNPTYFKWPLPVAQHAVVLEDMTVFELRAYARLHYSSIGKLTKKAELIAAIRAMQTKSTEVTF